MSTSRTESSGAVIGHEPVAAPAREARQRRSLRGTLTAMTVIALLAALAFALTSLRGEGFRFITVHGGSMGDAMPVGSLAVARWQDNTDVHVGDVILVREQTESGSAAPKLHRVIEVTSVDGLPTVKLKGDANETADAGDYQLTDRVLVADFHVPYIGYVVSLLGTPAGWALSIAIPFTVLALMMIASIWRPAKKSAADDPN